ncbi:MAG: CoA-binding protein [Oligoflexia bacterium]|nr:MAG: CoA-binding protein [Oligoflexia bacterium]
MLENEVYDILKAAGFSTPLFQIAKSGQDIKTTTFSQGQEVVLKGLAPDLWHKSDLGLVQFQNFDTTQTAQTIDQMRSKLPSPYQWAHALVLEKISFQKSSSLPTEIFFALKHDDSCGWILLWGIGGVQSELWAHQIPPLNIPLQAFSEKDTFKKMKDHLISQIILGTVRGGKALTQEQEIYSLVQKIYRLLPLLDEKSIQLLEINPLVLNSQGEFIPLDGVGVVETKSALTSKAPCRSLQKLFRPQKIGIIGVSKRQNSPTNIILENAKRSQTEVLVINDYTELETNPVDLLIVGINPKNTFELCNNLLQLGKGADYLYLVTGGILDGSDHEGFGKQILHALKVHREAGKWTPTIIGPNGLGLISSPLGLNTMFIPQDKLEIKYQPKSPLALISQSGAYLITRFSSNLELHPKYAISIGSKMDLKISDLVDVFEQDPELTTLGLYVEGFDVDEALRTAQKMKQSKKNFVLYKGGRSSLGAQAAQSHTGAMMTEFGVIQSLFSLPNVSLCQSFTEWSVKLKWLAKYPQYTKNSSWGFITNAGYESVGSGDFAKHAHYQMTSDELKSVQTQIEKHNLQSLVTAANPLDLTPMASEEVWLDCIDAFFQTPIQTLLLGIVPLTQRLNTHDQEKIRDFGQKVFALGQKYNKQIGIIIDSGSNFDLYRETLKSLGLLTFSSIEEASLIF